MDFFALSPEALILDLAAVITIIGFYIKVRTDNKTRVHEEKTRVETETRRKVEIAHNLESLQGRVKRLEDKDLVIFQKIDALQNEVHGVSNSLSRIEGYIQRKEEE